MAREIAERCDLCGEYRAHTDLLTVHAIGEPVDVCTACRARPVADVLDAAQRLSQAHLAGSRHDGAELIP